MSAPMSTIAGIPQERRTHVGQPVAISVLCRDEGYSAESVWILDYHERAFLGPGDRVVEKPAKSFIRAAGLVRPQYHDRVELSIVGLMYRHPHDTPQECRGICSSSLCDLQDCILQLAGCKPLLSTDAPLVLEVTS